MTLHIHHIYDTPKRQLQAAKHQQLRHELEEEKLSRQIVDKHNAHLQRSNSFRRTGELSA